MEVRIPGFLAIRLVILRGNSRDDLVYLFLGVLIIIGIYEVAAWAIDRVATDGLRHAARRRSWSPPSHDYLATHQIVRQ
jgi:hypothetical protein